MKPVICEYSSCCHVRQLSMAASPQRHGWQPQLRHCGGHSLSCCVLRRHGSQRQSFHIDMWQVAVHLHFGFEIKPLATRQQVELLLVQVAPLPLQGGVVVAVLILIPKFFQLPWRGFEHACQQIAAGLLKECIIMVNGSLDGERGACRALVAPACTVKPSGSASTPVASLQQREAR